MRFRWIFFITAGLLPTTLPAAEPAWQSLLPALRTEDAVAGKWAKAGNSMRVSAAPGARIVLPVAPTEDYDFRISFTRESGQHSIGLLFTHGGRMAAFEVDAWGQHLAGIQNVDGQDIRQNASRRENITLRNGQRYTLTLEVRRDRLRGLLDDQELVNLRTSGENLSLSDLWRLPQSTNLAIAAWDADTTFHAIEVRSVSGTPLAIAPPGKSVTPESTPKSSPTSRPATTKTTGKRVLLVIANQDFFYREYHDPRQELERAGIQVVVAAGRKQPCRPHDGSGQGADGGIVTPDITLAEAKAADYDAILFSGGWGASMYQYAFTGRYTNSVYNGDQRTKGEVNRLINEFIAADKYTCALCNAVSVLAWARVQGQSPLRGKRVCAPTREAPAGIYNGRPGQPSCRWHPEQNGALLSPSKSIGDPNSVHDDVHIDGKIITGEDDGSARVMGQRLAHVLSNP